MIKVFKFRAQAIFSLLEFEKTQISFLVRLEKTHPPGSQNLSFFSLFYIISTQGSYIHQKLDTNSCFAKLRAIQIYSVFFIHPVYRYQVSLIDMPLLSVYF
jgi:hypothetical protein